MSALAEVLGALQFAADKHRDQRRKGAEASPFINHPIEVACLLAHVGGVTDSVTLQAAVLHDTIEDTETTPDELERVFGPEVRRVVEEVTDDTRLPRSERKRLQVIHAPTLSARARLVEIADKIANVRAIRQAPPAQWTLQRRCEYLDWSDRVVAGCRGCSAPLEVLYDREARLSRQALAAELRE